MYSQNGIIGVRGDYMIYSKLSELMKRDELTITKLANDTNISRTTLTSLFHNTGNGIQFDTINILCDYFGIEISELLVYIPYDIEINLNTISEDSLHDRGNFSECLISGEILFTSVRGKERKNFPFTTYITIMEDKKRVYYECDIDEEELFRYQEFIDMLSDEVYKITLFKVLHGIKTNIFKQLPNINSDWKNYSSQPILNSLLKWDKWDMYNYLLDKRN